MLLAPVSIHFLLALNTVCEKVPRPIEPVILEIGEWAGIRVQFSLGIKKENPISPSFLNPSKNIPYTITNVL